MRISYIHYLLIDHQIEYTNLNQPERIKHPAGWYSPDYSFNDHGKLHAIGRNYLLRLFEFPVAHDLHIQL